MGLAVGARGVAANGGGIGVTSTAVLMRETMAGNSVLATSGVPSLGGRPGQVRS